MQCCAAGIWLNIGNLAIAVGYLPAFFPEKLPLATNTTLLVAKGLIAAGLLAWQQASSEWLARKSLRSRRSGQAVTSSALLVASVLIAIADVDGIKLLAGTLTFSVLAPLSMVYCFHEIKKLWA
ncbi:hypothetical protein LTR97_000015 [Elasticomyces elasticus]|uniref:Uncharacterized protein n=1 Tax=Elasticomyces elasticus TaxID=574655 RepID=A0AAN7WIE0_9PEZI|nr:hypothetical protein LTR97_000015 [Elasticomyces elasticus]